MNGTLKCHASLLVQGTVAIDVPYLARRGNAASFDLCGFLKWPLFAESSLASLVGSDGS